jgi:hypothetical protein
MPEGQLPVERLVTVFLSLAGAEFSFLGAQPRFQWTTALKHTTANGFEDTTPDRLTGFVVAYGRFENARVAGEVTFGDREYSVNAVVGPAVGNVRYGFWEWADALDRPDLVPRKTDFVLTLPRMQAIVAGMASGLRALESQIGLATPTVVEHIEAARRAAHARFETQLRESEHRRASSLAGEAFRAGRFARVVELLESVEDQLSHAEQVKLAYARERL